MSSEASTTSRIPTGPALAAGSLGLALALVGSYLLTPWRSSGDGAWGYDQTTGLAGVLLLVAFAAAGVAVVFGVIVPRGLAVAPERTAVRALALVTASVLSIVVFWSGLPVILAAGATVLALDARTRTGRTTPVIAGSLALAALVTLSAIVIAFTG